MRVRDVMRAVALAAGLILPGLVGGPVLAQADVPAEATAGAATVAPEVAAAVAELSATMRIADILDVLREEGIAYGATLEEDMFPGSGGAGWQAQTARIHDGLRMREAFGQAMMVALAKEPDLIVEMQAFFGSDLGQRVLSLELAARRALLDDAAEEAAQIAWEDLQAEGGPRVAALERFAEVNDLIESNVMGAMNASLAFYAGLAEGGAYDEEITEDQVLSDVWSQEEDIRRQTAEWLFPYLALSYEPLSDEELQAYITFSETEAGQALNVALFVAFDAVFTPISKALGLAVAKQMQGQDI